MPVLCPKIFISNASVKGNVYEISESIVRYAIFIPLQMGFCMDVMSALFEGANTVRRVNSEESAIYPGIFLTLQWRLINILLFESPSWGGFETARWYMCFNKFAIRGRQNEAAAGVS